MDKWNPFKEDYEDTNFNSYSRGPGRHLPQGNTNKQDGVQLYVTGIPIQLPPEGLKNLFLQTGTVKHVKIMPSKIEGSQNTFGFVTMSNLKEATDAISKLNNFQIDRFKLRVQACQSQEERDRRRRKREEDDAFLNTLNCAKNPQQEDSDEDISKTNYNGINHNVRAPNDNLKIDIPNVSLSDLDDSIIKQGPPSLKIASSVRSSSNSSISDLTITVGNQSRLVKPNTAHREKSGRVNGVGRGLIGTDLSASEKSYRGMAQALNNNPYNPHSSLYERMTSYESTKTNGGKQCLYCRKIASSLCSRCKMPYCGPECQTADWSKHKNICAQVSVMPKELPVEDDGFEVSLGEDIYEYLPKEDREAVKQVCGNKLTSYIKKTDEGYRNLISKVSPTHSSPKPEKISPTKHSPAQNNQKYKASPNKQTSNKDKPSPNKSPGKKGKDEISIPYYKDLPTKVINMNTDILTIVTFIESPDKFWVSETQDMEHAFVYSQQLEKDPGDTIKKAPISGQLFACKYEGMWCRSQVLTLSSDSQIAKISYFDFGNVENVPLKRLHYLPINMATVYPLAIECKINGIYPTDVNGWPKNCLLNYIQPNSLCTINVKQKYNSQCLVTLKGSEGADVIKSMIEAKIAQKERGRVYSQHLKTLVQQLKPGQEIRLIIVIAKSPRDFKAQIDEPTYRNTLDAFTTELDRVCEQNSIKQYRPEVNEIVSCKYVDSHWYRAVVLKVTNAAAIVYFLDYGDEQEIIQSNIQPLSGEQLDYPAQAIKCSLKDVQNFDPSTVEIVDQKFSDISLKLECKYKAKVVNVQGNVAIVDLLDNKGKSVSDILKDCIEHAGGKQKEQSARPAVTTKQTENLQRKSPSPLYGAQSPKKVDKCETESLPLNRTVSCVFGSFLPNSHFYVSLFSNFPFLAEIMNKINEECSRTPESYLPKTGEFICALFQGAWYRARVLMKNGNKITVYFVDYGNTCDVSVDEIRKMNPGHLQLPAQAIHCCFDGIDVPISGEQTAELETILQHDKFNVKVSTVVDKVHKVVVTLADSTNINEMLIQALSESHATVNNDQPTSPQKKEAPEVKEKSTPKATSSSSSSDVSIVQLPINKPVECIFTSFLPEAKFCVGLFESLADLAEVMNEINTECSASEDSYLPKIGEYVAALFESGWYRAEVLNILDDKITVLFIDYGNTSDVSVKEIRKLNPKHLKLPAQAITCLFYGIDAPLSKDQQTQLEGILQQDKLSVEASSVTDGVYKVTVLMSDSTNINEVLSQAFSSTETTDTETSHADNEAKPKTEVKNSESKSETPKDSTLKVAKSQNEADSSPEVLTEKLPLNQASSCIFSSFIPESQFCVGLFEKLADLAEVMNEINTECSASEDSYLPKIGEYVAALFEGGWYRAEVLNILDDKITVLFIDYGNTSDVSVKEIRKLNPKHLKLPAQAITCSFYGIDAPLSKDQQTQLEGILQQDKLSVEASSVTDGVYKVTVLMSDSTNINEVLSQALTGTETTDTETSLADKEVKPKTDNKQTEEKTVPLKSESKLPEMPTGSSPTVATSQNEAVSSPEVLTEKLPLNQATSCIFSSFIPESQFCVGLFEKLADLAEVMAEINTECSASEDSYLPKIGEYVAALFEGGWYRAEVLNILDDKITVLFIDYGNTSDVSVKEIRKLNPKHLKLPAQAITCLFYGIDASLSKDQQTQLEGILQQDKLSVEASSVTDGVYKVTVIMSDSTNINEVLSQAFSSTETTDTETSLADKESKPTTEVKNSESKSPETPKDSTLKVAESRKEADSSPEVLTEKLPLNQATACIFSSFRPESQFCVGLFESLADLAEVMNEINTECSASEDSYLPKIGEYVAALFEGGWYRAEVLNILDDKITVLFIDYGNTSDVSVKEIRKLNPKHLKLPAQAITCSFDGIDAPLSKDQQTQLEGILQQDKLSVEASSVTDGVYKVTVIMSDSTNINEVLSQALTGTETKPSDTEVGPTEKTDVKDTEQKTVPTNSETKSQETLKGSSPKHAESQIEVPTEKLPLKKPIKCVFTSFLPDSLFCVSLQEKFTDLAEIMMKMNEECKATPESYLPKIGEYVCALFQQLWYRAKVLNQTEDKFNVVFIDYGNTSDITVAEIRKLNPDLLEFPAQAISCSFDGVKNSLTSEQQTELESIFQNEIFIVQAISVVDGIYKVVVVLENGSNINEVLKVAQGETMVESDTEKPKIDTLGAGAAPVQEEMKKTVKKPLESESKALPEISPCDFPLDGSEVLTMFATFLSSREFCVLKADSYPTFCELSVEVNNYCTSNSDSYKPVIGECVCALYQDAWYRARVENITDDKYTVVFVDFGNTHQVSSSEIRKILPCHLEFPAQAVKCCFAGLKSGIDESKKAEVESFLAQAAFNVKIVGIQDGVHLAIVTLSDGTNLNENLIALLDKSDASTSAKSDENKTQTKFFELKSTESIVSLDKSTSVGFVIQHINGICDFYVLVSDSSVKDALEAIDLEISNVKPVEYKPMKGEYVCCLFEGVWYRAVVIDITSDADYDVLFIDYGNRSLVASSSVRQFTTKLASIPPLALHCSLYNVIDNGRDSLVKFAEFLNGNNDIELMLVEKKDDTHFVNVILSSGQCLNNEFRPKSPITPTVTPSEIRQEKLPQDRQVPCIFSCFLQDSVFCVSLFEQYSKLAEIMNTLNGECSATPESYLPKIGDYICASYQNMWYRAKVLNQNDDKFTVLFIDYGNTSDISVEEIRKLNPSLLDLPAQAIRCSLYGVNIPLNNDQQAKIEEMLNKDIIKIQASSIVDEIYKVIVYLTDGTNINDFIIQNISGSHTSEEKPPKTKESKNVEATPEPTPAPKPSEKVEASMEPIPAPKREIQHYRMTDMKFVVPSDDELTVIFTHVVDPDNIYCHSASDGSTEAMIALSNLCQSMADYCEKSIMDVEPLVDHLYCGLMGEDWYRCVVKELRNDKVLIQYIDIGEQKEISKHNLRPFLPEFMTLPVYIFKCAVNGVKPIGEKWGTGAGHLINSFTGDKNKLKVVRREEKLLYCDEKLLYCDIVTGSSHTDLKTELIQQCLGVEKTTVPQPTPEEDEEEAIRRQIAELQAKLASKLKT